MSAKVPSRRKHLEWLFTVAEEFYERQKYSKAKKYFERISGYKRTPLDRSLRADVYAYLADISLLEGDPELAKKYVEVSIRLDPNFAHYRYMLAVIFETLGDFSSALKEIRLAVNREPKNSVYLEEMGRVYLYTAHYKPAELYLKRAVKSDPSNIGAVLELLTCLYKQERYHRLIQEGKRILANPAIRLEVSVREYLTSLLESAAEALDDRKKR